MDLLALVEGAPGLDVLVVGDALLDGWLCGDSVRLSREAPVQVVAVGEIVLVPGGAANTAVNLAALGARVRFVAAVGDDADGVALRRELDALGVRDDDVLIVGGRRTLAKRRITAGGQQLLRVDEGDQTHLPAADERRLLDRISAWVPLVDVVVVSDYGLGTLGPAAVRRIAALRAADPELVLVVDARDPTRWAEARPTAVKPNAGEAALLLGGLPAGTARAAAVEAAAGQLLDSTGARIAAVTLDVDGAVVLERGRPAHRVYARESAPHAQAAGAGDTFTAAFAVALGLGADAPAAGELAATAAGVSVGSPGTTPCTADELRAALLDASGPLLDPPRLRAVLRAHRLRGRRVVLTNGHFDGLHRGHVAYLNRAKALGDVLVVGLNSDPSVRGLLGHGYPRQDAEGRAAVLAGLSCVDHVVAFDGPTAAGLLDLVRPDVYAKGGDYTPDMLPEAPLVAAQGGAVVILPWVSPTDGPSPAPTATAPRPRSADLR